MMQRINDMNVCTSVCKGHARGRKDRVGEFFNEDIHVPSGIWALLLLPFPLICARARRHARGVALA